MHSVSVLAKISSSVVLFEALFWAQMNESLSLKVTASFTNKNRFSHSWFPIYQFVICTSSVFPGMFWIVSPTMNIGLNSSSMFSTIAVVVDQLLGQLLSVFIEVEHGTFTPLIFDTNGAMGTECSAFHKILAKKVAQKTNKKYCEVMSSIRTKIYFSLIKSALLCLRGSCKY